MKKLVIVESPAKIKTLSKFLGKDFTIVSTFGHVKDLPSKKIGVEIGKSGKIALEYDPLKDKAKVIKEICDKAKKAGEVYLASDPDREGEIIAWHIGEEVKKAVKGKAEIFRISFNEITKPAVLAAIENKGTVDMDMVNAQQARRVLDRWVGYEVSPILWKKITKGLSAGRVQSAALLLVCNREEEILSFKPVESWSVHGSFANKSAKIDAELARIKNKPAKLKNKKEADAVIAEAKKQSYSVTSIENKTRLKKPLPPFMTATLQQDSYNKLGFSVDNTMRLAQKLYEGLPLANKSEPQALITYMRTDSLRLSDTALKDARGYIKRQFGDEYLPGKANTYGKGAQDAHEAIRPISVSVTPEIAKRYLPAAEAKLYGLIWKRFMGCQMTPAQFAQRTVNIEGGDYLFKITGSTLIFDGFLKVYLVEDEDDKKVVKIPAAIKEGLPLDLSKIDGKQHFTVPPPRYTEASLVKEMKEVGIGRPSTYAATLATIQKRSYVIKEKKRFSPTELGKAVSNMLATNLPDIINVQFTAQMEEYLDKIAAGTSKRDVVLGTFYKKFSKDLEVFGGKDLKKQAVETKLTCTKCKKNKLVIRFGKRGEFAGCSGYPDCDFTSNFIRNEDGTLELMEREAPVVSELTCPNCGKNLVQKTGRFGPFLSCPGYPECKYIHTESLKMPCPKCKGKILKRRSRSGSFWGCGGYPKCKFAIFGTVVEKPCKKCKAPFMVEVKDKTGKISVKCNDKECK